MVEQVGEEPAEVLAIGGERIELAQSRLDLAIEHGPGELQELALSGETEHGEDILLFDGVAAETDELVECGLGVAQSAFSTTRDGEESFLIDFHLLLLRDISEMLGNQSGGNAAEIISLT